MQGDPPGCIFQREFPVPLPRISSRYLCALRSWVPPHCTSDGSCGLLVLSTAHSNEPTPSKGADRVFMAPSGIVLLPAPDDSGRDATQLVIFAQIDVQRTLQRMLRGAFKSGLLKIGLRSGFQHVTQLIDRQMELFNI